MREKMRGEGEGGTEFPSGSKGRVGRTKLASIRFLTLLNWARRAAVNLLFNGFGGNMLFNKLVCIDVVFRTYCFSEKSY